MVSHAAADEKEHDVRALAQPLCRIDDGVKFMGIAHVPRIHDQKSIFQLPRLAQRVAFQGPRPDLLAIAPVVNDFHPLWRHAETDHLLRHVRAYHHIAARAPQGSVAHGAQRACRVAAHEAHAQSLGNLGKQIVQPVHEMCTTQFRHPSRHHRNQWRIGFRNDHVAGSAQTRQPPAGTQVKTQIVESPADEIPTAKVRAPHAVHFDVSIS
jgi:hypothetical protein